MAKQDPLQIRLDANDRAQWKKAQSTGGWVSLAAMVRHLVAQYAQHLPATAQPQPDHQPDEPPL